MKLTFLLTSLALVLVLTAAPAVAQNAPAAPTGPAAQAPAAPEVEKASSAAPTVEDDDARTTRQELNDLLRRYPPDLGTVLRLDPTLLRNETYLASYPALAEFATRHPEVSHNPEFFLEQYSISQQPVRSPGMEMWMNMMGGLAGLTVMAVAVSVLVWFVRMFIEQRRWNRLTQMQTEVHTKLLDRFSSNEDVLAYMGTSAGKRFLEAAPIPVDAAPRSASSPASRILWSVQLGVVLISLGVGLLIVSGNVAKDVGPGFFVMGIVAMSVGVGFGISALISTAVSRKLGLTLLPPEPRAVGADE